MLENLFNLVKNLGQDQVVNNPEVPNEHNDAVIAEATHSVASELQNAMANGQHEDVANLLQGQTDGNPVAQNMQSSFIDNITSKLGINQGTASNLAASFIPMILSKLTSANNGAGGNDMISGLLHQLTGGSGNTTTGGGGISSLIGQFTNGNNGGGGIASLISQFTGGAQRQQAQQGSGGLMDIIKGFMH
jgi:hypothetical protein